VSLVPKKNFKISHYNTSKQHILDSVAQSLKNIRIDYIDVLLLHRPDILMNADEVAEALTELHTQGKVRFFGVSNYSPSQFDLLQSRLPFSLVTNQIELSPVFLDCLHDGTLDQCQKLKIVPMAWSPVRGIFIEQARVGTGIVPEAKRQRLFDELTAIGKELGGLEPDQVALVWILTLPTSPIPVLGTSKPERVEKAVAALKYRLTREQWYRVWVASKGHPVP